MLKIFDALVAALVLSFYWMLSSLPKHINLKICITLGRVANILRVRRSIIAKNLLIAFPDMTDDQRKLMIDTIYTNFGRFLGEWLLLNKQSDLVIKDVKIEGIEIFSEAFRQGKGVLCCSAHLGHWEILAAAVAGIEGVNLSIIRRKLNNTRFDRWFTDMHERVHVQDIIKGSSMREILKRLRRSEIVGMLVDQSGRGAGVWVPFFGRPSSFHRGPGIIVSRMKCPAVIAFCIPDKDGKWIIRFEELKVPVTGNLDTDTYLVMSEYARHLEAVIREFPERYFWFHHRWKTIPPKEIMQKWESGEIK